MENTQCESINTSLGITTDVDMSIPIQELFDQCLNFISITDFEQ